MILKLIKNHEIDKFLMKLSLESSKIIVANHTQQCKGSLMRAAMLHRRRRHFDDFMVFAAAAAFFLCKARDDVIKIISMLDDI